MEKDLVYTENNGTQDVYDVKRIAISKYAAKELCGPIAYVRESAAARPRIALEGSSEDEEVSQPHDDGRASG